MKHIKNIVNSKVSSALKKFESEFSTVLFTMKGDKNEELENVATTILRVGSRFGSDNQFEQEPKKPK